MLKQPFLPLSPSPTRQLTPSLPLTTAAIRSCSNGVMQPATCLSPIYFALMTIYALSIVAFTYIYAQNK